MLKIEEAQIILKTSEGKTITYKFSGDHKITALLEGIYDEEVIISVIEHDENYRLNVFNTIRFEMMVSRILSNKPLINMEIKDE